MRRHTPVTIAQERLTKPSTIKNIAAAYIESATQHGYFANA